MATVTKGKTFVSGETVEPADLHQLVDSATVTGIVNADIDANAEIAASKLAGTLDFSTKTVTLPASLLVPAGAIMPFAMNSAPTGWLSADGSNVSRSTYAALFAAIGTTYGAGNGSTTFALPDLRGYFVRGSGTNSDSTASGTFGAKQADEFKAHRHFMVVDNASTADTALTDAQSLAETGTTTGSSGQNYTLRGSASEPTIGRTSETGTTETRPKNIAMLYCIKT